MSTLKSVQSFVSRNSSRILTILGAGGMVATTVLAVRNTPKALKLIERRKAELETEKLTVAETVKTTWKCYIAPLSICISSLACLIGGNIIDARKIAELSAAYSLSEDIFREYKNKVIETMGEEKEKTIQEEADKKIFDKSENTSTEISLASFGDFPCYDKYSKSVFWSTKEKIGAIINKLNFQMLNENYISLSDYCFEFGLDIDDVVGDQFGWNVNDGYLEPVFSTIELNNEYVHGRPVLLVKLNRDPDRYYDNLH